jgi:putative oxidoreductase
MSISEYLSPLLGRLVLAWFFLAQVGYYGVPLAPLLLVVTLMLLILGSLSLIFGFHTRHGAMLLFGVVLIATMLMHDFWRIADNASARQADFDLFARNIAIAGGLLLLVGMGPGPVALDNRMGAPKKK